MLVVRVLDVTNHDAGCGNQDKILKAGMQVNGIHDFARVADAVVEFDLLR